MLKTHSPARGGFIKTSSKLLGIPTLSRTLERSSEPHEPHQPAPPLWKEIRSSILKKCTIKVKTFSFWSLAEDLLTESHITHLSSAMFIKFVANVICVVTKPRVKWSCKRPKINLSGENVPGSQRHIPTQRFLMYPPPPGRIASETSVSPQSSPAWDVSRGGETQSGAWRNTILFWNWLSTSQFICTVFPR